MSYTTCVVKNMSGSPLDLRRYFDTGEEYTVPDTKRAAWGSDSSVHDAIVNGDIQIGDGSAFITDTAQQIAWLLSYLPYAIEVEKLPPFAEPLFRTKNDATDGVTTCPINTVTTISYVLPYERYVSGGLMLVKNAEFGDYISSDIHDTDSVIPEEYRASICESWPIVATYINKQFVKTKGGVYTLHDIDTRPLNAKITAGLYLRVSYHAINSGSAREVAINYDLQNKL